jgi:hypothetical protein
LRPLESASRLEICHEHHRSWIRRHGYSAGA